MLDRRGLSLLVMTAALGLTAGGGDDDPPADAGTPDVGSPCEDVDCSALDDACNQGVCNPGTGMCEASPRPDGTSCTDMDACTLGDVCMAGTCTATSTVDCTGAEDACNTAASNTSTGQCDLSPRPDGTACSDMDACTLGDACVAGTCTSTGTADCTGAADDCNAAACNSATGACDLTPRPDGTVCSDANACTSEDACDSGVCVGPTPTDCSGFAGNCLVGACDPGAGCFSQTAPMGTSCMDNNACTSNDMCDSMGMCIGSLGACGPGVAVVEAFDANDGGFTTGGTASSWAWGVPQNTVITQESAGDGEWVTNLTGNYNSSESSFIESPAYDFGPVTTDPVLRFSHIFRTEACCDEGWVETSTDGGTRWSKLGAAGEGFNWYNDATNDWWDGASGAAGERRTASILLSGTAGVSDVRFRFVFASDGSVTDEGFSVDDFTVVDGSEVDPGVTEIVLPPAGCG